MTPPRNALVAGGGIAGAATALALQKAGIEPVVYESRASAGGLGAFLTLGSNGIEALSLLGAGELARTAAATGPAALPLLTRAARVTMCSTRGRRAASKRAKATCGPGASRSALARTTASSIDSEAP